MIYFARCEQDTESLKAGWIKIGTTTRLSARLQTLAYEIGHKPVVLGVLDGAFAEEHALHVRFKGARQVGEWFHPNDDLLRLIETEARPWDRTDEVPARRFGVVTMDADALEQAKLAASLMRVSVADYLSDLVRRYAGKDITREARKLTGGKDE